MKKGFHFHTNSASSVMVYAMLAPALIMPRRGARGRQAADRRSKNSACVKSPGIRHQAGVVQKVKAIGLQKYIDQQLNPASINDSVAESKVKNLDIFNMSTAELFAKYPNPGALIRQLEGDGKKGAANAKNAAKPGAPANPAANADPIRSPRTNSDKRRQKLQAYYQEYNLKPAAQIVPEIAANRILRAVYSERQLQEVMVDFWQNHFNVFAGKAAVRWYIPSYERDVLRKNALGNFKDLLVGTAQHPAMLFYLDNFESVSPNAQAPGNNAQAQRIQQMIRSGQPLPPQRARGSRSSLASTMRSWTNG